MSCFDLTHAPFATAARAAATGLVSMSTRPVLLTAAATPAVAAVLSLT